jgi:Mn2+/Fe2+ NRAMP family transporter
VAFRRWVLVFGPGLVFALASIGPGDLISNSAAGASHGYSFIWVLALALFFRWVWLNTAAKYVVVTGESLLQGYARVGRWMVWAVFVTTLLARHLSNLYMVVFMGNAAHLLLPLPTPGSAALWSLFFVVVGFTLMIGGGYQGIEKVCQFLIAILGFSLILAALKSNPDPQAVLQGMLFPSLPFSEGLYSTILLLAAIIGTETGSLTNLTYAYFIYEKGWTQPDFLRRQRIDLALSVACIFVMGTFMQVAAAGTLQSSGIELKTIQDLATVYTETQGQIGKIIFAVGFWAVAFSSFIGLTTGYSLIVDDIYHRFIRRRDPSDSSGRPASKGKSFRIVVAVFSFSPLYILFLNIEPVLLTLIVSALFLVAMPVLAYGLLRFTNDRELMGVYQNGWYTNAVIGLLIMVAVYLSYSNGLELFVRLKGLLI